MSLEQSIQELTAAIKENSELLKRSPRMVNISTAPSGIDWSTIAERYSTKDSVENPSPFPKPTFHDSVPKGHIIMKTNNMLKPSKKRLYTETIKFSGNLSGLNLKMPIEESIPQILEPDIKEGTKRISKKEFLSKKRAVVLFGEAIKLLDTTFPDNPKLRNKVAIGRFHPELTDYKAKIKPRTPAQKKEVSKIKNEIKKLTKDKSSTSTWGK